MCITVFTVKAKIGDILWVHMAQEARKLEVTPTETGPQNFTELVDRLSPEELKTLDKASMAERVGRLAAEKGTNVPEQKGLSPELMRVIKDLTPQQLKSLNVIVHDEVLAQERSRREEERTPAVPLAAAAGGGMLPPTEHANENLTLDERERQVQVELENFSIKQENEKKKKELETQLAGQVAMEKALEPELTAEKNGTYVPVQAPNDPSIIPPQTRDHSPAVDRALPVSPQTPRDPFAATPESVALNKANVQEMSGVGSNWADAGKYIADQAADKLPYSVVGRYWAKLGRFTDVVLNAGRREILWSRHNMHSELAAKANGKVEGYRLEVAKLKKSLLKKIPRLKEVPQK